MRRSTWQWRVLALDFGAVSAEPFDVRSREEAYAKLHELETNEFVPYDEVWIEAREVGEWERQP